MVFWKSYYFSQRVYIYFDFSFIVHIFQGGHFTFFIDPMQYICGRFFFLFAPSQNIFAICYLYGVTHKKVQEEAVLLGGSRWPLKTNLKIVMSLNFMTKNCHVHSNTDQKWQLSSYEAFGAWIMYKSIVTKSKLRTES